MITILCTVKIIRQAHSIGGKTTRLFRWMQYFFGEQGHLFCGREFICEYFVSDLFFIKLLFWNPPFLENLFNVRLFFVSPFYRW